MQSLDELLVLLEGRRLESIRPGSSIYVREVDLEDGVVRITDSMGRHRNRSVKELSRLWEMLDRRDYIHVDSALGGSGSSRNQPETILANLPVIEWLIVEGRKCLTMVAAPTHGVGTIRRMDAEQVALLVESHQDPVTQLIVSSDPAALSAVLGAEYGEAHALEPGVYVYKGEAGNVFLVREGFRDLPLVSGSYAVVRSLGGGDVLGGFQLAGLDFVYGECADLLLVSLSE